MHRFTFGFVLAVIGASTAVDVMLESHVPLVPLAMGVLLVIWGARMMTHAISQRARRPRAA